MNEPTPEQRLQELTPTATMYDLIYQSAKKYPAHAAYTFFGCRYSYGRLLGDIDRCSRALQQIGIKKKDSILVSLPTCPQALIAVYAINRIGAVSHIIHPLSPQTEIEYCLKKGRCRWALTLDLLAGNFLPVLGSNDLKRLIITRITDYQNSLRTLLFKILHFNRIPKIKKGRGIIKWSDLMKLGGQEGKISPVNGSEPAVILYTGGTDGYPKGVVLSSHNINHLSLALLCHQVRFDYRDGDKTLATLPVFHGFGLAVVIHTTLISGGHNILVPRFISKHTARLIKKEKPHFLAGVPTFYEALLREKRLKTSDLSCIKGAFVGGDMVAPDLVRRFDEFLKQRKSPSRLLEGYGLTESVSACSFMPPENFRTGSAGLPLAGLKIKIINPENKLDMPPDRLGEICISGPTVMLGYLDEKEATSRALQKHEDGKLWLHSGDIGRMSQDGFLSIDHRRNRTIKCSGMTVIPQQVEKVLNSHPAVSLSCLIGIEDDYQVHRLKALIVLEKGHSQTERIERKLRELCEKKLIKWSIPGEIEFRTELPLTKFGKVDYRKLQEESTNEKNENTQ
jgi:long-chain acyl-CoA synthetase